MGPVGAGPVDVTHVFHWRGGLKTLNKWPRNEDINHVAHLREGSKTLNMWPTGAGPKTFNHVTCWSGGMKTINMWPVGAGPEDLTYPCGPLVWGLEDLKHVAREWRH